MLEVSQLGRFCTRPALFLPGRYNDNIANSADLRLEVPILLTFKEIGIILIFWLEKGFKSQFLMTRVILQLVSKQAMNSKSKSSSRCWKLRITEVVAYV